MRFRKIKKNELAYLLVLAIVVMFVVIPAAAPTSATGAVSLSDVWYWIVGPAERASPQIQYEQEQAYPEDQTLLSQKCSDLTPPNCDGTCSSGDCGVIEDTTYLDYFLTYGKSITVNSYTIKLVDVLYPKNYPVYPSGDEIKLDVDGVQQTVSIKDGRVNVNGAELEVTGVYYSDTIADRGADIRVYGKSHFLLYGGSITFNSHTIKLVDVSIPNDPNYPSGDKVTVEVDGVQQAVSVKDGKVNVNGVDLEVTGAYYSNTKADRGADITVFGKDYCGCISEGETRSAGASSPICEQTYPYCDGLCSNAGETCVMLNDMQCGCILEEPQPAPEEDEMSCANLDITQYPSCEEGICSEGYGCVGQLYDTTKYDMKVGDSVTYNALVFTLTSVSLYDATSGNIEVIVTVDSLSGNMADLTAHFYTRGGTSESIGSDIIITLISASATDKTASFEISKRKCGCEETTGSCTDTDNGKNAYKKGTATDEIRVNAEVDQCWKRTSSSHGAVDSCSAGMECQVKEGFCHVLNNEYSVSLEWINCPYGCKDGACINPLGNTISGTCYDSDGKDSKTKGMVYYKDSYGNILGEVDSCGCGSYTRPDTCVWEKYCDNGVLAEERIDCSTTCADGRCLPDDCADGTKNGDCIPGTLTRCEDGQAVADCRCGTCPSGLYCPPPYRRCIRYY